jgi:hypothetical protein
MTSIAPELTLETAGLSGALFLLHTNTPSTPKKWAVLNIEPRFYVYTHIYKSSARLLYMHYLHEDLVFHQVLTKREIDVCWMAKGVWVLLVLAYFF